MLDAPMPAVQDPLTVLAFAYHPEDPTTVILVTEGQHGFLPVPVHLSPRLLNDLLFDPPPTVRQVDAMVAFAFDEDAPELTDLDVTHGWPT